LPDLFNIGGEERQVSFIDDFGLAEDFPAAPETTAVEKLLCPGQAFFQRPGFADSFIFEANPHGKRSAISFLPGQFLSELASYPRGLESPGKLVTGLFLGPHRFVEKKEEEKNN